MTRQVSKKKELFPSIPRSSQAVDERGQLTAQWALAFNTLFEALQQNFSSEGFSLPVLTQDEQNTIENAYQQYVGAQLPAGVKDITGYRIVDAPHYDQDTTATDRVPKIFIIQYNSDHTVASAQWKTYTIT